MNANYYNTMILNKLKSLHVAIIIRLIKIFQRKKSLYLNMKNLCILESVTGSSVICKLLLCVTLENKVVTYLLTYLFTYLLNYLLTYLIIYLLTHLFTYLLTYLIIYLLTYLLNYLLTYLFIYLLT